MSNKYFRIQDARFELPTQSGNYWQGGESEVFDGVCAFVDLYTASRDLLGGADVDGIGINYAASIVEDGGTAILSVFEGEMTEDDSTSGVVVEPDRSTEKRLTVEQLLAAWLKAVAVDFADDAARIAQMPVDEQWATLSTEFDLSNWNDEATNLI